jgi:hypothetical protein
LVDSRSSLQPSLLKLTKNGKIPGENYINSELYKRAPEEFKLRLLKFLNNIYKKCIPNERRNTSVIPVFKKMTEEALKIREKLVFLTPTIRYTLKSSI